MIKFDVEPWNGINYLMGIEFIGTKYYWELGTPLTIEDGYYILELLEDNKISLEQIKEYNEIYIYSDNKMLEMIQKKCLDKFLKFDRELRDEMGVLR